MTSCLLLLGDNKKNFMLEEVEGYRVSKDLFIHKDKEKKIWVISDYASGARISEGYHTFAEAQKDFKDKAFLDKVAEQRKTLRYKALLKKREELYKEYN